MTTTTTTTTTTTELSYCAGRPIDSQDVPSHLQLWKQSVSRDPSASALIVRHQKPGQFRWVNGIHNDKDYIDWTYADLDRGARRLATELNRLHPINRHPIVTLVNTQAEWALFFWAAAYLHAPMVPINPKIANRAAEMSHMMKLVQPAVIVAADPSIAQQIEESLDAKTLDGIPTRIVLAEHDDAPASTTQWRLLSNIMTGDLTPPDTPTEDDPNNTALILFTSGTTSLPKPCAHSSLQTANAGLAYGEARQIAAHHRFVHHLPGFHAYGITWGLVFWYVGGTVVYPSDSFEAQASLECIERFHCTHTSLVPTTAQSIIAHPSFGRTDIGTLISVDISGAGVLPSVVEACETALKVPGYTSYGMTESPGTLVWPEAGGSVLLNGEVLSGRVSRGAMVKICVPGTTDLVPRGVPGELHNGGLQVIASYIDPNVATDSFYQDEQGVNWIKTGDQAVMEQDGAVRISGRYKDLIIRGGENISPASIEALLQKMDGVDTAQVVGAPDEMAGEVPIAVIRRIPGCTADFDAMKVAASTELGPAFAPKLVLDLENDLGTNVFPTTASGKIRKVELAEIVRKYLAEKQGPTVADGAPTVEALIAIWQEISGANGLKPSSTLQSFSDSLMMMQLSGTVKKHLGKDITVEDFKLCETIQNQADLIDSRADVGSLQARVKRAGPPSAEDMPHVKGCQETFERTKAMVCEQIAQQGLEWEDVEDVVPLPDWDAIWAHRSRPQSWTLRWSCQANVSPERLEAAIKETLPLHPTMRPMVVEIGEELPLLVSIRGNDRWWKASMTTGWEVEKKEDLINLLLDHPELDAAAAPGPLFRTHIAKIKEDGTAGLILVMSHAINDMSMTKLWLDDMLVSLSGEGKLIDHASFKDYAEAYYNHREGVEADNGIQYWTEKLQGVGSVPESTYWPPRRAAQWLKGNDFGWTRWDGTKARKGERSTPLSEKKKAQKGIRRRVEVADIATLKAQHGVPVFMLVKAALAMLNVSKTGGKEAIFSTLNAARTWPFASDYTALEREAYAGNPLDISGCTCEYVLDRIRVPTGQSVVSYMQKVTSEEEQNSSFAHAPFLRIIDRLRDPLSPEDQRTWAERDRDAASLLDLARRQSFNWLPTAPSAQSSAKGLNMLELLSRMDNGLTVTGFLLDDKKSVALSFTWDAEHLTAGEAEAAMNTLARLVEHMGKAENWDSTVGHILSL
ncbi:acetyl-CoA synthetase-like protein [Polychaeton citri CBS 116435]|uniref:Acetyl-CoA synthetase-like protein n=1 Tax=Polychaeton citri CBS 116435 TaxID=1314669 RepID=A0A9P4UN01_9PEZI|nr:acetyl-CoA synthetase-like protein [Polychaeton citri CBS 116435]